MAGDALRLVGARVYCRVGHTAEERAVGHHLEVDVELGLDLREAGEADDMGATADYAAVHQAVLKAVAGREFVLLEAVAEAVAEAAGRAAGPRAEEVVARVRKFRPPMPHGEARYAEVEVRRQAAGRPHGG